MIMDHSVQVFILLELFSAVVAYSWVFALNRNGSVSGFNSCYKGRYFQAFNTLCITIIDFLYI